MGRRSRRASGVRVPLTLLLLLAAALAFGLVRTGVVDVGGGAAPPADATLDADLSAAQHARVLDVVDGDTIDVEIQGRQERVRYYGSNTPERGDPCYREAVERNRELAGTEVLLLPDRRDRDRYGRLLRYVFTTDGHSLDAALVSEGLARAWTEDGAYRDVLVRMEEGAQAASRGCLWSP
ncbi:MAG TPA: thermonuclease family protein [Dehalococcoidia bacterium]